MLIRAEQMNVFAEVAERNFARRLTAHLLENYAAAMVRLPDIETTLDKLPAETLHALVEISIERARRHDLTFESSISAFSALMFEVSPNFDAHRLSQVLLNDENTEPNERLAELLSVLTEKNWESIREDYDVDAWRPAPEASENAENAESANNVKITDSVETTANTEPVKRSKPTVSIDDISFDDTIGNYEKAKKPARAATDKDFELHDTVPNFVVPKEK